MLNARWEVKARQELNDIVSYIGDRDLVAAGRIEQAVMMSIERLCAMPYIGRPGRVPGSREWVVHPNYVVIYRVGTDTIDVLRVLHARQRYP